MSTPRHIVVLGGGPDAEREVSLNSSKNVADKLAASGLFTVERVIIDRPSAADLRAIRADLFFPVLHGGFGEGGPLQDLLEADRRPFVGCRAAAARHAMDKVATKMTALSCGIPTARAGIFFATDAACPFDLPVVLKPVHEGSSVGVHLCHDRARWEKAREAVARDMLAHPGRVYMVEKMVVGNELTIGVFDPAGPGARALAPIHIKPAVEFYDYEAKYNRDDTQYIVDDPALPAPVKNLIREQALTLARAMGVRHLCRVDFLLDSTGKAWLLEVNTMPGFTAHSLYPMAATHAGMTLPELCTALANLAWRDAGTAALS